MPQRLFIVAALGLTLLSIAARASDTSSIVTVSPGSLQGFSRVEARCPTFSWGGVPGSGAYELLVYQLDGEDPLSGEGRTVLRATLPGTSFAWTPSLEQALQPGHRYAWIVRMLDEDEAGEWSQARLFQVAEEPSLAEIQRALQAVRGGVPESSRRAAGPSPYSSAEQAAPEPLSDPESSVRTPEVETVARDRDRESEAMRSVIAANATPGPVSLSLDGDVVLGAGSRLFAGDSLFMHGNGLDAACGFVALAHAQPNNYNTAFGAAALHENTSGAYNTAVGTDALFSNTEGEGNTAVGEGALSSNTEGEYNTAIGRGALRSNEEGTSNTALGISALHQNEDGGSNTAVGSYALYQNISGSSNTAVGKNALVNNQNHYNTAVGRDAMINNQLGTENTAAGRNALAQNYSGSWNTAVGSGALFSNYSGLNNVAIGANAMPNNDNGIRNVAIGVDAGSNLTSGGYNIYFDHNGVDGESYTIRIGDVQTRTFIAGIRNKMTANPDALTVRIDSAGQLGTLSSSRRYKEAIQDMDHASDDLLKLRPVTFHYKTKGPGGAQPLQFGLIAEEVAEVYPEMVVYDDAGRPEALLERFLSPMLLNELQKQARRIESQEALLAQQRQELQRLANQVQELTGQLAKSYPEF